MIAQSENIADLAAALAKAQATIEDVEKHAKNPHFKSTYATLADTMATVRGAFAPQGLSIVQFPMWSENAYGVTTQINHASGQWMRATAFAQPAKNDPQGIGSLITYLRRYSAQGAAGIASADPREDDDGEAASQRGYDRHVITAHTRKEYDDGVPLPAPRRATASVNEVEHVTEDEHATDWREALTPHGRKLGSLTGPEMLAVARAISLAREKLTTDRKILRAHALTGLMERVRDRATSDDEVHTIAETLDAVEQRSPTESGILGAAVERVTGQRQLVNA